MLQHLRFAVRTLGKTPVFTLTAIAMLALGIGANTAIFQLIDAVRLRSLPLPDPQRLARIQIRGGNGGWGITHNLFELTYPLWQELQAHQQGFSAVLAWENGWRNVGQGEHVHPAAMIKVSGGYFEALGVAPAAGRLLRADDDRPGCVSSGVVLSYPFWQSEFGGDPSAIGRRLIVDDRPFEIVGVTRAGFSGLEVGKSFDFAAPLCALHDHSYTRRDVFWLNVMGRLKPGWTVARGSEQLAAISPDMMQATVPSGYSTASLQRYLAFRLEAVRGDKGISGLRQQYSQPLTLLLALTGLVLLMACANLANLMLARAGARQREFAVRLALGAARRSLVGQSVVEGLLLAMGGAALGLVVAGLLSRATVRFLSTTENPLHLELVLDWRMLAFTAAIATAACLLFGLLPAFRSTRIAPSAAMRASGRGLTADRGRFSFQRFLIVAQITISLVLVSGAFLFVRSFRHLMSDSPGFRSEGILVTWFDASRMGMAKSEIKAFQRQLLNEVRTVPQVEAAAATTTVLIGGGSWSLGIRTGGAEGSSKFTWVSPGSFATLGTPLLEGRDFDDRDTETSPRVAVVNRLFAAKFFPGADPVGKTFRTAPEPNYPEAEYQVVGLIENTRYWDLRDAPPPMAYAPLTQYPAGGPWAELYIRSSAPAERVEAAVRRRVSEVYPRVSAEFHIFRRDIEEGLVRERLMAALSGMFGGLAILMAAIGLYGVLAYIAVRRRNEIGIRMALGATRVRIIRLVMGEAALLLVGGGTLGVGCSTMFARAAAGLLFGFDAQDPVTFVLAAALLAAVTALGSFLPAWRAGRLDPMSALREE